ncbi:STE20/SPS1-related proline-alanine-rich protein kinase [Trichinella pseudospiralis]|uniref:non-specific serine/threonine protein kinase n=1 Tax=Trichinella pseudospiralis TaxID=6337 RepID=A0A0V1K5D7_TRIPS|nr:STE20/SPS1-related proline-alanine-rich protein kinase [Trichinella pseudospiralis]KRZ27957.1 STE20/SPS1-related proline-alanine-rich protein kinase [Trichinella pseudospiralis]KRZ42460.1 STE20/SPS1-related proline-alanine-rich protein kinase [Trichinella pseudospiralis]
MASVPGEVEAQRDSLNSWPNKREDYELKELIGVGATASVYSAICLPRNEKCAIKQINLEKCNTSMDELLHEIQAMRQCSHPNVVSYYTSFVVGEELWVVMKLLSCGSFLDILKNKMKNSDCKHGVLDEVTIATIMKEVLKGLEYFHNNGQIHRDIKAGNILLSEDGTIQIADFGVSSWLATGGDLSRQKVRHTFVGTPCWMAPEVMEQVTGYDFKADIWSFGILAIELATGTAPYHKYPPMKVLMLTLQNDPPTMDTCAEEKEQYKYYGKTFRKMVAECLQKDPTKRPTATELLKHSFFKKAKDRRWLVHALLETGVGVNLQARAQHARRLAKDPAVKLEEQEPELVPWVFQSSESEGEDDAEQMITTTESAAPAAASKLKEEQANVLPQSSTSVEVESPSSRAFSLSQQQHQQNGKAIHLVLRLRNASRELNDIKFEFTPGVDTVEGVSRELVGAGLINSTDVAVVSSNLHKIVDDAACETSVIFALVSFFSCMGKEGMHAVVPTARYVRMVLFQNSGCLPNEIPDEKTLVGFGQLSIVDNQSVEAPPSSQSI